MFVLVLLIRFLKKVNSPISDTFVYIDLLYQKIVNIISVRNKKLTVVTNTIIVTLCSLYLVQFEIYMKENYRTLLVYIVTFFG